MPATIFDTVIGSCGIAWEEGRMTRFFLPDAPAAGDLPPYWVGEVIARVRRHLAGTPEDFSDLPYDWERVSSFQRAVYQAALQVKSGQTWSYGRLTTVIGEHPVAARAAGSALGDNPWPLLVPCHRFIGADGRMTGFSSPGGIKTKLRLLVIEGSEMFAQ